MSMAFSEATLLIDQASGEMAGECLVYLWGEWPLIGSIAVRRNLQGLAGKMIRHALNTLHAAHPVLRLFSTAGNVSGSLYNHLGFISGPTYYEMVLPHPQATSQNLQVPKW